MEENAKNSAITFLNRRCVKINITVAMNINVKRKFVYLTQWTKYVIVILKMTLCVDIIYALNVQAIKFAVNINQTVLKIYVKNILRPESCDKN